MYPSFAKSADRSTDEPHSWLRKKRANEMDCLCGVETFDRSGEYENPRRGAGDPTSALSPKIRSASEISENSTGASAADADAGVDIALIYRHFSASLGASHAGPVLAMCHNKWVSLLRATIAIVAVKSACRLVNKREHLEW